MAGLQHELVAATDAALISRVRLGDRLAFETLARRHLPAMRLLAELLAPAGDPERVVGEGLDVAYHHLRRVAGPQASLRTYLLLLTRRLTLEEILPLPAVPFRDHQAGAQHRAVGRAFARLPEGWQGAVWHLEVEQEAEDQVATVLGVATAGVRRLVASARTELRTELLRSDGATRASTCGGHMLRLARARGTTPPRSVLRHATRCTDCTAVLDDLDVVERDLPGTLARHLLGPAADAYVAARREQHRVPH